MPCGAQTCDDAVEFHNSSMLDVEMTAEDQEVSCIANNKPTQFMAESLLGRGGQASVFLGRPQDSSAEENSCHPAEAATECSAKKIQLPTQTTSALKVYTSLNNEFFE